jgi:hypothetical protein
VDDALRIQRMADLVLTSIESARKDATMSFILPGLNLGGRGKLTIDLACHPPRK